jgi:hypothetical protein
MNAELYRGRRERPRTFRLHRYMSFRRDLRRPTHNVTPVRKLIAVRYPVDNQGKILLFRSHLSALDWLRWRLLIENLINNVDFNSKVPRRTAVQTIARSRWKCSRRNYRRVTGNLLVECQIAALLRLRRHIDVRIATRIVGRNRQSGYDLGARDFWSYDDLQGRCKIAAGRRVIEDGHARVRSASGNDDMATAERDGYPAGSEIDLNFLPAHAVDAILQRVGNGL